MRSVIGRFAFTCAVVASACVAAVSSAGSIPATIVENGPATDTSFRIGGANSQVEAVIWAQTFTSSTSISALIGSLDGQPETVDAILVYGFVENVIGRNTVTVGSFASAADFTSVTLFSNLTLASGAYGLFLFNSDTTGNVNVRWSVGATTTNTANGQFVLSSSANGTNTNVTDPNLSDFQDGTGTTQLGFNVTGIVPEPSSFALLGLGCIGVVVGSYRRRQAA
jgi:hypothetical protein